MENSIVFFIIILISITQPNCGCAPAHVMSDTEAVVWCWFGVAMAVWFIGWMLYFDWRGESEDDY